MDNKPLVVVPSPINYSYATIKLTQSRIDKGLIAIPKGLAPHFPSQNANIQIHLNESPLPVDKRYSSYTSSTHECRIGGVSEWFEQNNLKSGDEIVIQFLDEKKFNYRLIPEKSFLTRTSDLEAKLDNSASEKDASQEITTLSDWTNERTNQVAISEYHRLVRTPIAQQRETHESLGRARENAPANIRTLLRYIYHGHCQVCDFWFLKKNKEPYFEIHHIDASMGHHPKNLLLICGNCHNQFEHAELRQEFDNDLWLTRVYFNDLSHKVRQISIVGSLYYKQTYE